jgi:hypothetical protein
LNFLELEFCEVRVDGVLRSPDSPGLCVRLRVGQSSFGDGAQTCSLCVRPMGGVTMTEERGYGGQPRKHEPRRYGPEDITPPPPGPSSHRQPCVAGLKSRSVELPMIRGARVQTYYTSVVSRVHCAELHLTHPCSGEVVEGSIISMQVQYNGDARSRLGPEPHHDSSPYRNALGPRSANHKGLTTNHDSGAV